MNQTEAITLLRDAMRHISRDPTSRFVKAVADNSLRDTAAIETGPASPVAVFDGYHDGSTAVIKWVGTPLPAGTEFYAATPTAADPAKCLHDWPEADGQTDMDGSCTKCGISFQRYIHTECP